MMNVLRMECFRMRKSFSTWIILAVYVCLYALAGGVMGLLTGDSGISLAFRTELFGAADEGVTDFAELFNSCMMGNTLVLITSVFLGMHTTAHTVTGFQKNLAGVKRKSYFVFSDLCICLLFNCILLLLGMAVLRAVMLVTHATVTLSSMFHLLRYCGVYLLLSTAYGMLPVLTAALTRSRIAAIAVPVVYCTMGGNLLYMILNYFAGSVLGLEECSVESYAPYGNICSLLFNASAEECIRAAVSAVIFILVCICISVHAGRKRDAA